MLIDRSHRSWAVATTVLLVLSVLAYSVYVSRVTLPSGGSIPGIIFGVVGFAMMAYAGLLGARKKVRIWRLGRAQTWMRGHLWLGTLSLPLILLHAGFLFGHGLTSILMWLFVIVWVSGLFGAWLQHTMPRRLLREVPMETIYDQIGHVRKQLLDEADNVVADACGRLEVATAVPVAATSSGANALATVMRTGSGGADDTAPLRDFYMKEMRPFVEHPGRNHALADPIGAAGLFGKLRPLVPAPLGGAIADLESICEEERQLLRQERLHGVLHGWLIVHVPLSFALMVLAIVHIFMALRF